MASDHPSDDEDHVQSALSDLVEDTPDPSEQSTSTTPEHASSESASQEQAPAEAHETPAASDNPDSNQAHASTGFRAYIPDSLPDRLGFGLGDSSSSPPGASTDETDDDGDSPTLADRAVSVGYSGLHRTKKFLASFLYGTLLTLSRLIRGDLDSKSGLSGYFYPTNMLYEDEEVLFATTPSRWQALGPYTLATLFYLTAAITPLFVYSGWTDAYLQSRTPPWLSLTTPDWWWLFPVLCVFFGTVAVAGEILHRASTWYLLTDSRLLYRTNPLDKTRKKIALDDINKNDDEYPIPYRFVGVGHIEIYTASTEGRELKLNAIKTPQQRSNLIEQQRGKLSGSTDQPVNAEGDSPYDVDEE